MSIFSFLYLNERLSEEKIDIIDANIYCEDVGMYTFSKYHDFEYNHVSLTNKVFWEELLYETISLTLLSLITKKEIEIKVITLKEIYFSGFIQVKRRVFLVKKVNEAVTRDLFSLDFLSILNKLSKKNKEGAYLNEIITELFDKYLGISDSYLKPEKKILLHILNLYLDEYEWLKLEEDYNVLGLLFKYKIKIKPIYIPRLKMQHEALLNLHKEIINNNLAYRQLTRRVRAVLDFNFEKRASFGSRNSSNDGKIRYPIPSVY